MWERGGRRFPSKRRFYPTLMEKYGGVKIEAGTLLGGGGGGGGIRSDWISEGTRQVLQGYRHNTCKIKIGQLKNFEFINVQKKQPNIRNVFATKISCRSSSSLSGSDHQQPHKRATARTPGGPPAQPRGGRPPGAPGGTAPRAPGQARCA